MQYEFVRDFNGKHQIGGEVPQNFKIPDNEFIAGFQYLGFIDNTDSLFSWLPFRVNLIHPIYTDEYSVFLDYTNPNNPIIIQPDDTASSTSTFEEINKNSKIIWEGVRVSLEAKEEIDEFESIGICGHPDWLQVDETPTCPKSGNRMKFLCQLGSFSDIKSTFSNVIATEGMAQYFENLNFWCDGNLYIFIEPTARTMCYTMQNT
ncbi:hypothetical protein [Aureibacter tunicatorum]|uniref:Uncharacterized protein n=1 Tax=Aureibacter tunicatorum TaxID=866807 RepID=A0AAE3XN42_9BACT|nr:hypothetical protein [Aureibacter tunicatorum]MDR6238801.1 hypothetical protein [Aureibacter tunicatorum]BDD05271.1 hypothetical protein AUTU_27540 [Aureibacter tunicatorum]